MSTWTFVTIEFSNNKVTEDFINRFIINSRANSSLEWFHVADCEIRGNEIILEIPRWNGIDEDEIRTLSFDYGCGIRFHKSSHDGMCCSRDVEFFNGCMVMEKETNTFFQDWEIEEEIEYLLKENADISPEDIRKFFKITGADRDGDDIWKSDPNVVCTGADTDGDEPHTRYFFGGKAMTLEEHMKELNVKAAEREGIELSDEDNFCPW